MTTKKQSSFISDDNSAFPTITFSKNDIKLTII